MRKRRLGAAALFAILALAAIMASSSWAGTTPTTTAAKWFTGASPGTELTGSRTMLVTPIGTSTLNTKLGTGATPVTLTSTKGTCVGCTIENKEVTSKAGKVAFASGKIQFEEVKVTTPAHCGVVNEANEPEKVLTKALVGHGDLMSGETSVAQAIPAAGAGTSFSALHIVNSGGTCSVAGTYSVTGTPYCIWVTLTGTFALHHTCQINSTIEENLNGGLAIGPQKAELTAEASASLSPSEEYSIK